MRPGIPFSLKKAERVRQMRRQHPDLALADLAALVGEDPEHVRLALATLRTWNPKAPRRLLNVTDAAREFVRRHALPGEPVWATVDRLFASIASIASRR
ncbi:hypothetical protein KPL78_06505 [Roseomonas sp. HJA6]|uniref:Uncharacterized protein n=1 Tax=Roseomonas alba TaxID=2846776 RepID=A0ABS7A8J5_9PROT|nr:hypothetical protein [Neoroseomonas alba]MBW6397489.1 hypothetical protein [Neoroseomonas alba]